jgi:hypothetical protein
VVGTSTSFDGPFTIHYSCNNGTSTFSGDESIYAQGSASTPTSASVTIPLYDGNDNAITTTCTVTEPNLPTVPNYTFGTATFSPSNTHTFGFGANSPAPFTVTTNNTLTRDQGTIIIIKSAQPPQGSFAFTTTGSGYQGFALTGATTNDGNKNSQTLDTGTYTATEQTQLGWILTGVGGSTDPNKPYNCVVTGGSGTSTGVAELVNGNLTGKVTITLQKGDTVTCTYENTGQGATRTQGFWATHPQLAALAWTGGSGYGHTFPGVATLLGDTQLCGKAITDSDLMGGFWSNIAKKSTGAKRVALDQARMQLLQQLLAAELNASAFGSAPAVGTFAAWESAYCGSSQSAISTAQGQAASFNSNGDSSQFTPGVSADSKGARTMANLTRWDQLP